MRKACTKCFLEKEISEYHADKSAFGGYKARCKECVAEDAYANRMKKYGISPKDYDKFFKEQNGRCAICNVHQSEVTRRFDIDHNHDTGKVRGLLCYNCNRALGLFKDSTKIVSKAFEYLANRGSYARTV